MSFSNFHGDPEIFLSVALIYFLTIAVPNSIKLIIRYRKHSDVKTLFFAEAGIWTPKMPKAWMKNPEKWQKLGNRD